MKRIICLILLPVFCVLASCNKEKSTPVNIPENTITAKVGDTYEKFAVSATVIKDPPSNIVYKYKLAIKAQVAEGIHSDVVTIFILSHNAPITTGIYKFGSFQDDPPTNAAVSFARNGSEYVYLSDEQQPNPATVTITEISDHNIKGTFSADMFNADPTPLSITDGKFNVNY